ncbi:MAG TPA: DHA2 family efflux MFS transporter permease subunit [Thermoleophilaceae bacterium]
MSAQDGAPPAAPEVERWQWLTLIVVSVGVLMVQMDSTIVNVALPIIREDLGFLDTSVTELQWVVNAYALSFAVLLLTAGRLADLFGRRRMFVAGLILFTGASAACGLADEINVLIGFRAVQGVGAALIMPASLSILQTTFPPEKLGVAIGTWSAIIGLGAGLGPLVGGFLAEDVDWRWVFYVNVPIGIAMLGGSYLWVKESKDPTTDRRLDYAGAFVSAASLFAITFALLKANDFGWGDPRTIGLLVGGALGLVAFVFVERAVPAPMLDLSLFRSTTFSGANVVAVLVGFSLFGLLFYGSLFMQTIMGFTAIETGLSLIPMMALIILLARRVGSLVGTVGPRPLLTGGMGFLALSLAAFSLLDFDSNFWNLLPGLLLGGVGFALVLTPLTAAALSGVPFQQAGMGAAVINSTRQVGGSFGLAVMGAVSAEVIATSLREGKGGPDAFVDSFGVIMLVGAGVCLLAAVAAWFTIAPLRREPPAPPEEPAPEEVVVEQPQSWAVAAPSVVTALPDAIADRAEAARGAPMLEVVSGPAAGARIPLRGAPLVLGRDEPGAGRLGGDAELSRRHASVSPVDGRVVVEDLGSTNGTRVNGNPISKPTTVGPGDAIEVGVTKLAVVGAAPAPATTGVVIKVVSGPATGQTISLGDRPFVFGRSETGAGSLGEDPELSRRHASAALFDPGRILIEDLGSTNGTFVNDHRIAAPAVVRAGDGIRLGTTTLEVAADGEAP